MRCYERWIGRHIAELLADDTEGWPGLYPLIDRDGEIVGITDTQSDEEDSVIVDWVDGAVLVRAGACDAAIRRRELPLELAEHARELLGEA